VIGSIDLSHLEALPGPSCRLRSRSWQRGALSVALKIAAAAR
jgi:hypothetical protein